MTLDTGEPAPRVNALNQHGERVEPSFADPTVLYFYPRDDTPGCTTEATEFAAEYDEYREAGVYVLGVSTDDVSSHRAFAAENEIPFSLLADPDGEVAEAFDVDHESGAAERVTFVIGDGTIEAVYEGVDPSGHAEAVLDDVLDRGLANAESD